MWYNFCVFSSGECRCISKRVPVFVTTDFFGAVVFLILAYLVVLLQVYGRRFCKFLLFCTFGLPPRSRLWWSWVVARLPLGLCPSGLNFGLWSSFLVGHFFGRPSLFLPRPSGLNPVGVSPFSFSLFCVFLSWLCAHSAAPSVWMFRS